MTDVILTAILVAIVGGVAVYLHRNRKRGGHCVGCPNAGKCNVKSQKGLDNENCLCYNVSQTETQ